MSFEILKDIIRRNVAELGRPDLFREPLCALSSAEDSRYGDLKRIIGPWHKDPRELLPEARSVISFFVPFTRAVTESVRHSGQVSSLWGEAYLVINDAFDQTGAELKAFLENQGYLTLPIAATHTYDPEKLQSLWSHRSAAAIAGLGSFGLNRLLITEKGSAGRFCTVLTAAPLDPSPSPAPDRCLGLKGTCRRCIEACPVGALKAGSFQPFVCHDRLLDNADRLSSLGFCDVCGKCIASCPLYYIE